MKILLIWHPITVRPPDPSRPSPSIPIGLAYLASVLEQENYEVKILDALALGYNQLTKRGECITVGLTDEEIAKAVESFQPDIVGISSMFTAYASDAYNCARIVKTINPTIPVVFGGSHVSINPAAVLSNKNVDIAVKGEGEITFLELVKALEKKENLFQIPGTVVRGEAGLHWNQPRPFIKDLDSLPFPAFHLLPLEIYSKMADANPFLMRQPSLPLITSRSCPYRCVYCSIHSVWGHAWRGRSPKNVVDEIEFLIDKYHVRELSIRDDNFTVNRKRVIDICDLIKERGLDVKWCTPNGVAIWTLNKEVIRKMKEAGCYRLTFGIESGNRETLKFIGKPLNPEYAKKMIKYANKIGLWTVCTFILGLPLEDENSIRDTINYALSCDTDFAAFYVFAPFPGTPAYEVCKKEELVKDEGESWGAILGGNGCGTKYLSKDTVQKLQFEAQASFMNKRLRSVDTTIRLIRKIHSVEDIRYVMKIIKKGLRIGLLMVRPQKKKEYAIEQILWEKN